MSCRVRIHETTYQGVPYEMAMPALTPEAPICYHNDINLPLRQPLMK